MADEARWNVESPATTIPNPTSPTHDASSLPYRDTPPPPPPKTASRPASGPQAYPPPSSEANLGAARGPPLPPTPQQQQSSTSSSSHPNSGFPPAPGSTFSPSAQIPPPSLDAGWLPELLKDKTKSDLESMLGQPGLLAALLAAPSTTHPSLLGSVATLQAAVGANAQLAEQVRQRANEVHAQRQALTTRLLQAHALERQWRLRQTAVDDALAPWSPKALHARLVAGVAEQEALCRALEESFIDGDGGGSSNEREVMDWLKRYREARKVLRLRKERKARFEEGRVGGWR